MPTKKKFRYWCGTCGVPMKTDLSEDEQELRDHYEKAHPPVRFVDVMRRVPKMKKGEHEGRPVEVSEVDEEGNEVFELVPSGEKALEWIPRSFRAEEVKK